VGAHRARFREAPPWHEGGDLGFTVLVTDQDQVLEPAPGTAVLAGSDFCEFAVCQLGDHILTFQGHPEFVKGYSDSLLEIRREMIGEATYRQGKASLASELDSPRVAQWIAEFIRRRGDAATRGAA
jgi:GMP synthase (glutamine-hydrolysing)